VEVDYFIGPSDPRVHKVRKREERDERREERGALSPLHIS
jgi:hypothetical protein